MYAEDILLLSASVDGLQHLCVDYARRHQLVFNCDKSVCMKVGCSYKYSITNMVLNNNTINWVDSIKYLGITFRGGARLSVDCADINRKFYVACNSVLGRCKYVDECVKLCLVKSMCLPLLMYCLGALVILSKISVYVGSIVFVEFLTIIDGSLCVSCSIGVD